MAFTLSTTPFDLISHLRNLVAPLETKAEAIRARIEDQSRELQELQTKISSIRTTIEIAQNGTPELPITIIEAEKYSKLGTTEAVLDAVNSYAGENGLTRGELVGLIKRHGLKINPKNVYSAVSITLNRLAATGRIRRLDNADKIRFAPNSNERETISTVEKG